MKNEKCKSQIRQAAIINGLEPELRLFTHILHLAFFISEKHIPLYLNSGIYNKSHFKTLHKIIVHAKLTKAMNITFNLSNRTKILLKDSIHELNRSTAPLFS